MSKSKKNQNTDPEVAIQSAINKTEDFLMRNSKSLIYALVGLIVVVGGFFAYKYLHVHPRSGRAANAMFVAEQRFIAEEFELALQGDGNNAGFLEIIDSFGSTPQGNLARHYAGICYYKTERPEEALDMLSEYKVTDGAPNVIINAQNFGLRGDILVDKEQYTEALAMYRKAIDASTNSFTTPYYLNKAGLVSEKLGDNAAALKFYERIRDEFGSNMMEARDIEKSIGRVRQRL